MGRSFRKYSRDELFFHEAMQLAHQWNRGDKRIPFDEYVQPYFDRDKKNLGWEYDFSPAHARALGKTFLDTEFDEHFSRLFYDRINPASFEFRSNELARDIDVLRDTAAVKEIVERFLTGESLFIVFGSGHAVIQERAIKILLS